jgi:two-component system, OmpR family, response regulator
MGKRILVVDDDPHIREVVQFALEKAGLEVMEAGDGQEALRLFQKAKPDLVILDITMPEMDGLEVCRRIRKVSDASILFLSSRSDEVDRVVGLEIGGDDYVVKPFSPRELAARVQAILKRTQPKPATAAEPKELRHGSLRLDVEGHVAFWKGKPVPLTAIEFAILKTLLRHPERVHSRDQVMDGAYDANVTVSDRTVDSHIRRIRGKYAAAGCKSIIETVHGVGYKLSSCQ